MHPVDEVDVGVTPGEVEALVARGAAAAPGVARAVGGAEVGLGLHQAEHQPLAVDLVHQIPAEQVAGHGLGGTAVEGEGEGTEAAQRAGNDIIRP